MRPELQKAAAVPITERYIERLEAELERVRSGQPTGARLTQLGERVLMKLLVGALLVLAMRYGLISQEEAATAHRQMVVAEESADQAWATVGDQITATLETCEAPKEGDGR